MKTLSEVQKSALAMVRNEVEYKKKIARLYSQLADDAITSLGDAERFLTILVSLIGNGRAINLAKMEFVEEEGNDKS